MSNQLTGKVIYTANQNISTEKGIAYSQALKFKKICYNRSYLYNNRIVLLYTLTKRVCNKKDTTTQTVTYNRTLYDLKTIIDKIGIFHKLNQN